MENRNKKLAGLNAKIKEDYEVASVASPIVQFFTSPEKIDWQELHKFDCQLVGRCQQREKIDWQEARKFDCQLVQTIFIFCCPSPIFIRHWRVARKSNFDSWLDLFPLSWRHPSQLVRTIIIFCCPSPIFIRHWRVARKSSFDS